MPKPKPRWGLGGRLRSTSVELAKISLSRFAAAGITNTISPALTGVPAISVSTNALSGLSRAPPVLEGRLLVDAVDEIIRPLLEIWAVGRRDAEQLGIDDDRQRVGELVHGKGLPIGHESQKVGHDLLDAGLQPGQRPGSKGSLDDTAESFVVGRIGVEHGCRPAEGVNPVGGHLSDARR